MIDSQTEHRIFVSFASNDSEFGTRMRNLLTDIGVVVSFADDNNAAGSQSLEQLREQLMQATITIVLIGQTTRVSLWVDKEIEVSTKPRKSGPGAGLIGVVLPTHGDFSKPYYEPELIPVRLHDRIQAEYAILKKWTEDRNQITDWLAEANRRRLRYDPTPSVRAMLELRSFSWSNDVDVRSALLSENPLTL